MGKGERQGERNKYRLRKRGGESQSRRPANAESPDVWSCDSDSERETPCGSDSDWRPPGTLPDTRLLRVVCPSRSLKPVCGPGLRRGRVLVGLGSLAGRPSESHVTAPRLTWP